MALIDQLREQRATARTEGDQILTRASQEGRDPTPEELADLQRHVLAEREAADAMEQERDRQLAEIRAMATRRNGPTLTREAAETARAFRSAIFAKNPAPSRSTPSSSMTSGPPTCPSPSWAAPAGFAFTPGTP